MTLMKFEIQKQTNKQNNNNNNNNNYNNNRYGMHYMEITN